MQDMMRNSFISALISTKVPEAVVPSVLSAFDAAVNGYMVTAKSEALAVASGDDLPELVKLYLASRIVEGLSKTTLENYKHLLTVFFKYSHKLPGEITANDIRVFMWHCRTERNQKESTVEKYRSSVSQFFAWCVNEGYLQRNPCATIKNVKCEKQQRLAMNQWDLEYIRKACQTPRERALVEVLYSTAARISEISGLKKKDIDWTSGRVALFGKGKKHRTSYLNVRAQVALKEYFATRDDQSPWVFVSEKQPHGQMQAAALRKALKAITDRTADQLSVPVTPHVFRHTTATMALKAGMPVTEISRLLGHEKLETTMIYAEVSQDDVMRDHGRFVV